MRSGMITGLILTLLVLGLAIAYRERGRGHLHRLEAKIVTEHEEAPVPRPGGQEAVVLTRTRLAGSAVPEFLSVAMLPGRGMNVLQITAYLPDRGEVNLLASPATVEEAERQMTGQGGDRNGRASLEMGGAIEAPWAGGMWGTPAATGEHIATAWRGHAINLPATSGPGTAPVAEGGRALALASDSVATSGMPDGGQADVTFSANDFGVKWPSKTEMTVSVLLSSRSIDVTVVARNAGDVAEPVGIGWRPRFAILNGGRDQIRLKVPGTMRAEVRDRASGMPTGALVPLAGTPYDLTARDGVKLGTMDLNDCFVKLHHDLLDSGPVAEFSDPASHYKLRLTALSPAIQAMHVLAPAGGDYVMLDPQFNYDDPFGREWSKESDTGMVVLQPGQTTQWKVRLELVSLTGAPSAL